ncbi:protein translocase subunit SecD [Intestinimonas sp. MSJ-38]|uniref:protein translocase subunit SecD n=1 Tax=Intestinimonas sp. MSJ-38 TaxID=2841532 RepID=UPI001C11AAC3|nr:protein translocase subunit SecD [Intestinimonas sp. MSJ-38]MBU5432654.1 protein translocase subunit SecD [Intestinimonas sp. MSJ-38]
MKKSILTFVCSLLVIALLGFTVWHGVDLGFTQIPSITDTENGVRLGLDLVGGSIITFEGTADEDMPAEELSRNMEIVVDMLRQRLDFQGLTEAQVYQAGDRRVTVEIPSISDPEEAVQTLGSTAQLQFLDDDGNVILEGNQVADATAEYGAIDSTGVKQNYVSLELTDEGLEIFTEATKKAAAAESEGKNHINIVMDGQTISSPAVSSQYAETGITSKEVMITGGFTAEEAGLLANNIALGQLPFGLEQVEMRSVGAQLGMTALTSSIKAGVIGVLLVMIFMIAVYRLPGVVSCVALLFYCVLEGLALVIFKVNLSLPGIAGIILSIGMAVDANVVIFERIKEELRAGKTIRSAIDSGFHRAFSAILDSNITTFIAAAVLYFFGKGTIVGFAITLGLGIILSMFTALTVTRMLLNSLVGMKVTNIRLYGAREGRDA